MRPPDYITKDEPKIEVWWYPEMEIRVYYTYKAIATYSIRDHNGILQMNYSYVHTWENMWPEIQEKFKEYKIELDKEIDGILLSETDDI